MHREPALRRRRWRDPHPYPSPQGGGSRELAEAGRMTDFARTRSLFHLPDGVVYLDGNSLGPLPIAAQGRVSKMLRDEWGELLIRGWNSAGWFVQPGRVGDRI